MVYSCSKSGWMSQKECKNQQGAVSRQGRPSKACPSFAARQSMTLNCSPALVTQERNQQGCLRGMPSKACLTCSKQGRATALDGSPVLATHLGNQQRCRKGPGGLRPLPPHARNKGGGLLCTNAGDAIRLCNGLVQQYQRSPLEPLRRHRQAAPQAAG